uniref:IFT140 first beta-propeller domain-containing protein n=1 Tax=Timema genevievae TaxID=629358 RepID=A0A7R9JU83_TIMGE|nr:unnamed protein product [Timema genevievae]
MGKWADRGLGGRKGLCFSSVATPRRHNYLTVEQNKEDDLSRLMAGLAKAAVAGDERALDLFSAWRPRTAGQRIMMQAGSDNLCFYVSSITGVLFYFNEEGTCTEVLNTDGSMLKKLLFHERKDCLIVMTEGLNIGQFNVDSKGNLSEVMKVKLSGRSQETSMVWAGPGLVAVTTGDMLVRCLDLDTGENYLLETTSPSGVAAAPNEAFTSLAYCSQKREAYRILS